MGFHTMPMGHQPQWYIEPAPSADPDSGSAADSPLQGAEIGLSASRTARRRNQRQRRRGKRARRQSHTPSQMVITRVTHFERGRGYKNVIDEYHGVGLTESGVKNVCERLRTTGTAGRNVGGGRKNVVRTESKVAEAGALTLGNLEGGDRPTTPGRTVANPKVTCGDAPQELGVAHATMRRLLKEDLGRKPLRQLTAQRVKPVNAEKRLAICHTWKAQIEYGGIGPVEIYWADGKLPRLGACPGNNENLAIWAKKELEQAGLPNDLILRRQEKWKGG